VNGRERWVGQHRQVGELALDADELRAIELAARIARRRHIALVAGYLVPIALGFALALAMLAGNSWKTAPATLTRVLFLAFSTFLCTLPFGAVAEALDPVQYGRRGPLIAVTVMLASAAGVTALWSDHPSRPAMALASALVVSQLASFWIGFHSLVRRRALARASRGLASRLRRDAGDGVAYEMETHRDGWNRSEPETKTERPFEPVLAFANVNDTREAIQVLPHSSVLMRVGRERVVERLGIVKITEVDVPDEAAEGDRTQRHGSSRRMTEREGVELRAHVARETRSFGWRVVLMAYWFLLVGRLVETHLTHAQRPGFGPRALLVAGAGFAIYLWLRVPPLRALRRDAREQTVVHVTLGSPYGSVEVLQHSRRVWSQQGAPASWRTAG
jgi:hypothetical protein